MKRQRFFQLCLATGAFIASPITLIANSIKKIRDEKGFMVGSGKDRFDKQITLLQGDTFFTKISTQDTNGDLYVYESTRLKEGGPPHHYHFSQDEWWYVLQGEFIIKVGEKTYRAKAGDSVFGPRMVPHSFAKVGEGEAKLLMIFQPAGRMEEFFQKVSEGVPNKMTEEERARFNEDYGTKQVGPPIGNLKR
ncbi:cupin domain-containing protein [Spirosoma sp. BT702]|uniref:Cupin domain-containing protein n=1 Tax=Spirosoma profusum TaxID=2771354 RepID=A0A927ATT4_9BACT|nr:cupin domain-containing protein [Spirosoma profusum]MBD2704355.1 cupin domain-containing protein [Spirosoma profusum]